MYVREKERAGRDKLYDKLMCMHALLVRENVMQIKFDDDDDDSDHQPALSNIY
jgi:hypothetical protein